MTSKRERGVKETLAKRRRVRAPRDTDEFLKMLLRMMRAAGRRVAESDGADLRTLVQLRDELDKVTAAAVQGQRRQGSSYADIGAELGISRQAAYERWGKRK